MMRKFWQMIQKWMKSQSECSVCGQFTPGKMKDHGVCLYCVVDRETLYDEIGWK